MFKNDLKLYVYPLLESKDRGDHHRGELRVAPTAAICTRLPGGEPLHRGVAGTTIESALPDLLARRAATKLRAGDKARGNTRRPRRWLTMIRERKLFGWNWRVSPPENAACRQQQGVRLGVGADGDAQEGPRCRLVEPAHQHAPPAQLGQPLPGGKPGRTDENEVALAGRDGKTQRPQLRREPLARDEETLEMAPVIGKYLPTSPPPRFGPGR